MRHEDEALANALRVRFGTGPAEPSEDQLERIKDKIRRLPTARDYDWRQAVHQFCPSAGSHSYREQDHSDLNRLLIAAGNSRPPPRARNA